MNCIERHWRNRFLRSIFGPEEEKLARGWRKLYYKHYSPVTLFAKVIIN
jgi:hypothetical protein